MIPEDSNKRELTANARESAAPSAEEAYRSMKEKNKKMQKKALLIVLAVCAAMLVLLGILLLIEGLLSPDNTGGEEDYGIEFSAPYKGDIFAYEEYMALNREIGYCENPSGYGLTVSVTDENRDTFDPTVLFLCDFVGIMTRADVEAYNACFNEIYYQTHTPKTSFSQQMIYDAKITYQNTKTDHNGDTLIAYSLAYKLWQNDGSVRRDVGSQAIVPLYVVLRVDSEGTIQIETMVSVRY